MNDNLPPLPPCAPEFQPRWPNDPEGYTADQMHAYAIAAIAAAPQPLTVAGGAVFQDAEGKRPVTAIGQPVGRWEPTPLFPPGGAGVFLERSQAQPQPVQEPLAEGKQFQAKFNIGDRAWFMKNNIPTEVIISAIEVFYVNTNQDRITYNAENAAHPICWLDHTKLQEAWLFNSKTELLASL